VIFNTLKFGVYICCAHHKNWSLYETDPLDSAHFRRSSAALWPLAVIFILVLHGRAARSERDVAERVPQRASQGGAAMPDDSGIGGRLSRS
jgi:hypothetical protein